MNIFDIVVVVVLAACMWACYQKGLLQSVFGLVSVFVSIAVASWAYPAVSRLLRGTALYNSIKQWVIHTMGLESFVLEQTAKAQMDLINTLSMPDFIVESLLENNNPVVHKLLDVSGVIDYIGGYFANILINALSFLLVLLVANLIMRSISGALGLIGDVPGLHTLNKMGGLVMGFMQGTVLIWIGFVVMTFFFLKPGDRAVYEQLNSSIIALRFYENNLIMGMIYTILA